MFFTALQLFTFTFLLLPLVNGQCGPREVYDGSRCFLFVSTPMKFQEANQYCRDHNYYITSIHSRFDNNLLMKEASIEFDSTYSSYFIGMNRINSQIWSWADGTKVDFVNWLPGEPFGANECSVQRISDGKWNTYSCLNPLPFVCSGVANSNLSTTHHHKSTTPKPSHHTISPTIYPYRNCTHLDYQGWVNPTNNMCYSFYPNSGDIENVFESCNGSIHSQAEDEFVRDYALNFFKSTGCFDNELTTVKYHIGSVDTYVNPLVWTSNNEPFDYYHGDVSRYQRGEFGEYFYVIANINPTTKDIDWNGWYGSGFDMVPSQCQYFLCRSQL